jgi:hypothetical protein
MPGPTLKASSTTGLSFQGWRGTAICRRAFPDISRAFFWETLYLASHYQSPISLPQSLFEGRTLKAVWQVQRDSSGTSTVASCYQLRIRSWNIMQTFLGVAYRLHIRLSSISPKISAHPISDHELISSQTPPHALSHCWSMILRLIHTRWRDVVMALRRKMLMQDWLGNGPKTDRVKICTPGQCWEI